MVNAPLKSHDFVSFSCWMREPHTQETIRHAVNRRHTRAHELNSTPYTRTPCVAEYGLVVSAVKELSCQGSQSGGGGGQVSPAIGVGASDVSVSSGSAGVPQPPGQSNSAGGDSSSNGKYGAAMLAIPVTKDNLDKVVAIMNEVCRERDGSLARARVCRADQEALRRRMCVSVGVCTCLQLPACCTGLVKWTVSHSLTKSFTPTEKYRTRTTRSTRRLAWARASRRSSLPNLRPTTQRYLNCSLCIASMSRVSAVYSPASVAFSPLPFACIMQESVGAWKRTSPCHLAGPKPELIFVLLPLSPNLS